MQDKWKEHLAIGSGLAVFGAVVSMIWPQITFWVGVPFLLIALVMIAWGINGLRRAHNTKTAAISRWLPTWSLSWKFEDWWPYRRIIPLTEAAVSAYDQLQGTLAADMAAKEDYPLQWMAIALWDRGKTPVYGTRPHATKLSLIPAEEFKRCVVEDNGKSIRRLSQSTISYGNLGITRKDLKRMISEIRNW